MNLNKSIKIFKERCKTILFAILFFACYNAHALTDKQCLGSAIWYESRGESIVGQRAVLDVILNRTKVLHQTICQVVRAPHQFSFFTRHTKWLSEAQSEEIIMKTFLGESLSKDALYYHNHTVHPKWDRHMIKVAVIGHHTFFTNKDGMLALAFERISSEEKNIVRYDYLISDAK